MLWLNILQLRYTKEIRRGEQGMMAVCIYLGDEESYASARTQARAVHKASYGALANTAYAFRKIPWELLKFYAKSELILRYLSKSCTVITIYM